MSEKLNIMINDDIEYQKTPENFMRFTSGHDFMDYAQFSHPKIQIGILSLKNNLGYWRPDGGEIIQFLADNAINPQTMDLIGDDDWEISRMQNFIENEQTNGHFINMPITKMQYAKKTPSIQLYPFQ